MYSVIYYSAFDVSMPFRYPRVYVSDTRNPFEVRSARGCISSMYDWPADVTRYVNARVFTRRHLMVTSSRLGVLEPRHNDALEILLLSFASSRPHLVLPPLLRLRVPLLCDVFQPAI